MQAWTFNRLTFSMLAGLLASFAVLTGGAQPAQAQPSAEAIQNYNQGIEAYGQGRSADAIAKFQRATTVYPAYSDAYYNMGSIFYQQKQYGHAADMFQKAVNLTPGDSMAKYNLALCFEKMNRSEEAINILSQIPASDPKSAQAKAKLDELKAAQKNQPLKPNTATQPKPAATPVKLTPQAFSKGFDGPTGITIGPGGFMYVANYSKNQIYRVGASGEKTVFAQGEGIKGPIGLAFNPKTNELYVANYLLNNVARISAAGKVSTLVGSLNKPYNLFMDTVNNALYISEQDPANLISRVNLPK